MWIVARRSALIVSSVLAFPAAGGGIWFLDDILEWLGSVWYWLRDGAETLDSNGATLRNLILAFAGLAGVFLGLPLAFWRSRVADSQADTAERGLRNERYQKAAEMLGSTALATRMGSIHALERLSGDHPDVYHIRIMDLLCTFARHPTSDIGLVEVLRAGGRDDELPPCRPDVELAAQVIGRRYKMQRALDDLECDVFRGWRAQLTAAILTGANLADMDLSNATLKEATLVRANLSGATLTSAILIEATLTDTDLTNADLSDALLLGAKGLTQAQLDTACQHRDGGHPTLPEGFKWDETAARKRWERHHQRERLA